MKKDDDDHLNTILNELQETVKHDNPDVKDWIAAGNNINVPKKRKRSGPGTSSLIKELEQYRKENVLRTPLKSPCKEILKNEGT